MKKILFSHSYFMQFDPKQWQTGRPYPPLGTLYAASLLRQNNFEVALFDTMFLNHPDKVLEAIELHRPDIFVVYDDGFNYLTKMCLTNMRQAAFRMCKLAKQKGCRVIVSGSDSTDHCMEYLGQGADYVILGEAEFTLLDLVEQLNKPLAAISAIKGLAYLSNGKLIKTPARPVLKELDILPLPAWDLVEMDRYKQTWLKSSGYFSLNMSTTRGCPFKCNWCAKPIYGSRYNSRSPENVVKELKLLTGKYGADHIWFCDDIFGLKPGWVPALASLIGNEQLHFRFKIQSRADLLLQDDQIAALAASGCESIWIGAESGSQKVLDAMDKGTTVDQIHEATYLMKKHAINPCFFIQFGYPDENKDDIKLTIQMINQLLPHEIGISVSYPLPGTAFYDSVKADLQHKSNWTDSDEMALMFSNTLPPSYYKQLHRYVHRNYRQHLARNSFKQLLKYPLQADLKGLKKALSVLYHTPAVFMEKWKLNQTEKSWRSTSAIQKF